MASKRVYTCDWCDSVAEIPGWSEDEDELPDGWVLEPGMTNDEFDAEICDVCAEAVRVRVLKARQDVRAERVDARKDNVFQRKSKKP
jgi:hypothetical protein